MVTTRTALRGGQDQPREIAAKTVPRSTEPRQDTPPHVWYVAFAPANAQGAVAVLVESGGDRNNLAATGGAVAAPIGPP